MKSSPSKFPLPLTPYPIKVRAIVRYRQGLRYGFEFLTLNNGQRDTIERVCQYLATRGYGLMKMRTFVVVLVAWFEVE